MTNRERNNIIAIIGMLIPNDVEIISPLTKRFDINLQLSTSMFQMVKERFPQQFHMVQSISVLVRALFSLMEFYNWTGPSVITSGSDPLYLLITEEILTTSKQHPSITIKKLPEDRLTSNIVIISMNIQDAVNLLCTAHSKNLTWPKYARIILSHSVDDFKSHAAIVNERSSCTADKLTEGIIFIQQHLTVQDHDLKLISGLTYNNVSQLLQHCSLTQKVNPYAYVLHDAIWTVALALNESNDTDISATLNDIEFTGASGPVKFVDNGLSVEILQVRDTIITNLGSFVNDNITIINHVKHFTELSNSDSSNITIIMIFYCNIIVCTVFTTLVLILHIILQRRRSHQSN